MSGQRPRPKEKLMADNTAATSWKSWTLTTKLTVGVGLAVAAVMVVLLYLPH